MRKLTITLALAISLLGTLAIAPAAQAVTYTHDQFSMMDQRRAGQYWEGGTAAGQWAWTPNPDTSSDISWGHPSSWPPAGFERFTRDAQWVYLEGYGDRTTGLFVPQVVTAEWIGDVGCNNMTPLPYAGGRQHYAKWTVSSTAYCLRAVGYMNHQGTIVEFEHRQVWFPPSGPTCSNTYYSNRVCIKQYERWWDDNGNPGGPLVLRHHRDNILALNLGPAFIVHNWAPGPVPGWEAHLRYAWAW